MAISDPDTFNAWEYTQGYNNSTTGRIWADKTVEEDKITFGGDLTGQADIKVPTDKGADFLVALSALSSYASTTTTDTQPLDIVMVLDASGSMDDAMGNNDSTKRMDALHAAVNNFIDKATEKNAQITDANKKIRLSIVKFSGKENTATVTVLTVMAGIRITTRRLCKNLLPATVAMLVDSNPRSMP